MNNWECIFTTDQDYRAEIIRAVLADNEIDSVAVNKKDSSYISIGEIQIFVKPEDTILARVIIEQEQL